MRRIIAYFMLAWSSVPAQSPAGQPRFEVSTVKPGDTQSPDSSRHMSEGRFQATNQTLKALIAFAYDIEISRVFGGPNWVGSDRYDIVAKTSDDIGRSVRGVDYGLMVQALLGERFELKIHRENRELPFYALVVAKGGPKLRMTPADSRHTLNTDSHHWTASGVPLNMVADSLSRILQRPVVDQTQLNDSYDFKLDWAPDPSPAVRDTDRAPTDTSGPSLFTALQEQLGLKLESRKGPVEVIVIDSAERPGEN